MGNNQQFYSDANPWQYCSFKDEEAKEGESKILRRKDLVNKELLKSNEKNLLTIIEKADCFAYSSSNLSIIRGKSIS